MTARRDSLGNPYRDLPQLLPLLQPLARRTHLLEREYAIHHRSQLPGAQHPHDLAVFRLVSHGRAQDTPLVPEEPPQVDGHVRAGGGAATHEPAAPPQRPQRLLPRRLTDVLDDDVAAALVRPPPDC